MGGMQSDFVLVAARTDPDEPLGITCFIVESDSAGVNREYIPFLIASGIWPARITLENVRVPARNVLGEINGGWKLLTEQLLWPNRIPFSAGNIGVGIAAHRLATEYSKQRETFGAPLSTRQAIQWMLVDNEVEMQAARWLTWQAAWAKDAGRPYEKEAAMAALVSAEGVCRTVDRSQQIHGGMGMSKWMPFERWYRESRARKLELGPMEVMRMSIAQHVLHPE
jgi:acyl-CoA dehydrogenase